MLALHCLNRCNSLSFRLKFAWVKDELVLILGCRNALRSQQRRGEGRQSRPGVGELVLGFPGRSCRICCIWLLCECMPASSSSCPVLPQVPVSTCGGLTGMRGQSRC